MEVVEIVIFISVALISGVLILQFLGGVDFTSILDGIKGKGDRVNSETVDIEGFAGKAAQLWLDCGMGEVDQTLSVFVDEPGILNKSVLFHYLRNNNLCNNLQSLEYECGVREMVVFPDDIVTPRVIRLECDSTEQMLRISG